MLRASLPETRARQFAQSMWADHQIRANRQMCKATLEAAAREGGHGISQHGEMYSIFGNRVCVQGSLQDAMSTGKRSVWRMWLGGNIAKPGVWQLWLAGRSAQRGVLYIAFQKTLQNAMLADRWLAET